MNPWNPNDDLIIGAAYVFLIFLAVVGCIYTIWILQGVGVLP